MAPICVTASRGCSLRGDGGQHDGGKQHGICPVIFLSPPPCLLSPSSSSHSAYIFFLIFILCLLPTPLTLSSYPLIIPSLSSCPVLVLTPSPPSILILFSVPLILLQSSGHSPVPCVPPQPGMVRDSVSDEQQSTAMPNEVKKSFSVISASNKQPARYQLSFLQHNTLQLLPPP